jgi:tricorn protease
MRVPAALFVFVLVPTLAQALPREPAVSRTHVAFIEAGQVWIVPRGGGVATRVTSSPGRKFTPRFSPDGRTLAFSSNEAQGEINLYTVSLPEGAAPLVAPARVTFLPSHQLLTQWTADGRLLFHTSSLSFSPIETQLFTVPAAGGLPQQLPPAYGSDGAIDPSGEWLAFTPQRQHSLVANWKRYRGGAAADVWLLNLRTGESRKVTQWSGADSRPMWRGTTLYYLSDEGAQGRVNVWAYEMRGGTRRQVTHFRDDDVRNASIGPDAIVFELGARIHRLDLPGGTSLALRVSLPPELTPSLRHEVDASRFITNRQLANGGSQLLIEARGDLWLAGTDPQTPPRNLTATNGVFEREASLSPDGRTLAYWSDAGGENQLYLRDVGSAVPAAPVTQFTSGFRFRPVWSPDSRRLAFADQSGPIYVFEIAERRLTRADSELWAEPVELAWSGDSSWLAYTKTGANRLTAIWRYDAATGERQQLTAEAFNAGTPAFDPSGERLFFISYRNFGNAGTDWLQQRIVHRATGVVMAVPLRGTPFDAASFERSAVRLATVAGSITALAATHDGNAIYGLSDLAGKSSVRIYDLREKREQVVVEERGEVVLSADGRHLLMERGEKTIVRQLGVDRPESTINTSGMTAQIDLRAEWRQVFDEVLRDYRDFFYAPKAAPVDWRKVRERYAPMLAACLTREEVNLVLGEMIGESGVGHAYIAARGDVLSVPPSTAVVAMLGADFALENGAFRITHVFQGAPWDDTARSPLREAAAGEYLLAVNGKPVDVTKDPRAAVAGMAGKGVTLTVGPHPALDAGAREIVVTPLANEYDLRRRAWIEGNRLHVLEAGGGRIGYVHIPDFTTAGFNDLARQYYGQIDKEALIVDARWSQGGWTGGVTAELLARPPLNYAAGRFTAENWPALRWGAHFGPKALLVNHMTVSAGENFASYFRKLGLGPLVGSRTWGGLTGLNPVPPLIDGGYVNVPNAPFFDESGWPIEGHGLDPDIEVELDPARMLREGDAQLDAAVKAMLSALAAKPYRAPSRP